MSMTLSWIADYLPNWLQPEMTTESLPEHDFNELEIIAELWLASLHQRLDWYRQRTCQQALQDYCRDNNARKDLFDEITAHQAKPWYQRLVTYTFNIKAIRTKQKIATIWNMFESLYPLVRWDDHQVSFHKNPNPVAWGSALATGKSWLKTIKQTVIWGFNAIFRRLKNTLNKFATITKPAILDKPAKATPESWAKAYLRSRQWVAATIPDKIDQQIDITNNLARANQVKDWSPLLTKVQQGLSSLSLSAEQQTIAVQYQAAVQVIKRDNPAVWPLSPVQTQQLQIEFQQDNQALIEINTTLSKATVANKLGFMFGLLGIPNPQAVSLADLQVALDNLSKSIPAIDALSDAWTLANATHNYDLRSEDIKLLTWFRCHLTAFGSWLKEWAQTGETWKQGLQLQFNKQFNKAYQEGSFHRNSFHNQSKRLIATIENWQKSGKAEVPFRILNCDIKHKADAGVDPRPPTLYGTSKTFELSPALSLEVGFDKLEPFAFEDFKRYARCCATFGVDPSAPSIEQLQKNYDALLTKYNVDNILSQSTLRSPEVREKLATAIEKELTSIVSDYQDLLSYFEHTIPTVKDDKDSEQRIALRMQLKQKAFSAFEILKIVDSDQAKNFTGWSCGQMLIMGNDDPKFIKAFYTSRYQLGERSHEKSKIVVEIPLIEPIQQALIPWLVVAKNKGQQPARVDSPQAFGNQLNLLFQIDGVVVNLVASSWRIDRFVEFSKKYIDTQEPYYIEGSKRWAERLVFVDNLSKRLSEEERQAIQEKDTQAVTVFFDQANHEKAMGKRSENAAIIQDDHHSPERLQM